MKIKFMSDLHLEFDNAEYMPQLEPDADVLILAGDITVGSKNWDWIERQLVLFPHVLMVTGNHEYYHQCMNVVDTFYMDMDAKHDNFHFFGKGRVKVIDDVRFIGATLWSDCFAVPGNAHHVQYGMNDFNLINKSDEVYTSSQSNRWDIESATLENRQTADFIRNVLSKDPYMMSVVFTHHAPSYNSVAECFAGNPLNAGYATNLHDIMESESAPNLWIHGHMHNSNQYVVGNTVVMSNPRGYYDYGPNSSFNHNKIVEVTR